MNLLIFQSTLVGQDFRLRKLGLAASDVSAVLNRAGAKFITTLNELGEKQAIELLGEDGAEQACQIAKVIAEAGDKLRKIYPAADAPVSDEDAKAAADKRAADEAKAAEKKAAAEAKAAEKQAAADKAAADRKAAAEAKAAEKAAAEKAAAEKKAAAEANKGK